MDSASPRSVLRDRSNEEGFATKSLIQDFLQPSVRKKKYTSSSPSSSSTAVTAAALGNSAAAGASDAGAASPPPTAPIITPEPSQAETNNPAACSDGVSSGAWRSTTAVGAVAPDAGGNTAAAAVTETTPPLRTRHPPPPPLDQTRPRPPPVACTLVAFEPGSLGLELEAIVDDDKGRRHGEEHRRRRRPRRRLGCRVFRVTPDGQAARHGSVHPGDALVVLDGVDVLSDPFEDITHALLQRQGRRRLIGFMGAAAVAASAPQKRRAPSSSSPLTAEPEVAASPPARGDTAALSPPPAAAAAEDSNNGRRAADIAAGAAAAVEDRKEHKRRDDRGRRRERSDFGKGGVVLPANGRRGGENNGGGDGSPEATASSSRKKQAGIGGSGGGERGRVNGHNGEVPAPTALGHHSRRSRSSSFASLPPPGSKLFGAAAADLDWREAERLPHPRDAATRIQRSRPAGGSTTGCRRVEGNDDMRTENKRRFSRTVSSTAGLGEATAAGGGGESDVRREPERERSGVRASFGGGSRLASRESLGSSWGSFATTGRMGTATAGGRAAGGGLYRGRPLDGSRGESLQRSLAEALEDKRALAAEREWLLEELQRAREATLERDGALAGQEVQTDVLKMEVAALDGELRRARQELGACEAGRRELHEAAKRDLARRDRDAADLADALRRERSARERDADDAAAAAATAASARAADKAAAAAGRAAAADARRRAESAEARAAESEERLEAAKAAAAEAAVEASGALRRERERREMEVREREEEISALLLRVGASESRSRRLSEDKAERLREVEEAAVKSLEAAERRRAEWENKASAIAARLREREAEGARKDRVVKDLEGRLGRAQAQASEVQEREGSELRRVAGELEVMRKALSDREARAREETGRLERRLREDEKKACKTTAGLRKLEQRAKFLETGIVAARQRAEAAARKEKEVSERLAEAETERACQEVAVTTLKAQLEELRRGAAAGDAALRETAKLRKILEGAALRHVGTQPVVAADCGKSGRRDDTRSGGGSTSKNGRGGAGGESLVELAEKLQGRTDELGRELDSVRQALAMARERFPALLAREKDAAELRSLLEQKRGVSARLASGAEAARVRAERAESQAKKMVADGVSLRTELKAARQQAETNGERAKGLEENVSELRRVDADEIRAMAAKLSDAEAAEAKARGGIDTATCRVSSLEEAMDAAEAERADVVRRLTRKDGDLVALQSRLEETLSELEAVKLALVEGPSNSVGDGGGGGRGKIPGEARVQATLGEGVAGAHVVAAAATTAAQAEADELKRQHVEAQEESRLARSELACVHLRTRMCGARVLSGVFHKWAARRAAGAFWRLKTTSTTGNSSAIAGSVVSSCARCGAAGTGRQGSLDGDDRPTSAVLTIEAPIPSSQGGGGGGGGSGSGSGWTSPRSGYNQSGEGERERPRSAGSDKCGPETTAPAARHRQNRDRSGTGAGDGFLRIRATANAPLPSPDEDSPGVFDFGGGHGGARGCQHRRRSRARGGNANGRLSPPPPSPTSSRARSMTSPPGGSFSIAWSNGGTDAVTPANSTSVDVAGGSGLIAPGVVGVDKGDTERSFFSTASSEPRYHCLRSGLSSPAWSNAGSWTGSADGVMPVDMSDASGEEEEEEGAATAVPAAKPVCSDGGGGKSGGQGGSEDGGRGGREVHGDGSEEVGLEFGLEVSVGGGDSWWALSDEEAEV
ncbi:unnamed protein product [Ectocarpus sp. CCAP 1310/34]|nr:unnamed protein product [Ectocarpus sp. CCAP 1310/34]